ncbi:MAG TPA: hypothetical protein CFH82_07865 [Sulfurospirillum sp. UBA12182]|nr:MAG TPA: hypothetical protein CFH82_07865 [Sulfurospirillum sp. UBA12182]
MNLLFISNDPSTKKDLSNFLQLYFDKVLYIDNTKKCHKALKKEKISLIILDVNDTYFSELIFLQEFRRIDTKTKIIMLSNLSNVHFLIELISLRLTKYVLKPINLKYFREIIFSAIDEIKKEQYDNNIVYLVENYSWNIALKKLFKNNVAVYLTKSEITIFKYYCNHRNEIFSYFDILDILDRDCEGDVNKAKMILKRLRKRLTPEIIKNIYGLGYRFNTTSCKNSSKHSH